MSNMSDCMHSSSVLLSISFNSNNPMITLTGVFGRLAALPLYRTENRSSFILGNIFTLKPSAQLFFIILLFLSVMSKVESLKLICCLWFLTNAMFLPFLTLFYMFLLYHLQPDYATTIVIYFQSFFTLFPSFCFFMLKYFWHPNQYWIWKLKI